MPRVLPAYIHPVVQEALDHYRIKELRELAARVSVSTSVLSEWAQLPETTKLEFCPHCNTLKRIRKRRSA